MKQQLLPRGWQLHNQERLYVKVNAGAPTIRLKFFHYPSYRQTVEIAQFPSHCKLKTKGNNVFFLLQKKARTKGTISLERSSTVFPIPFFIHQKQDWGNISEIPKGLQQKYKQSSRYWPVNSSLLEEVSQGEWFATDDLLIWTKATSHYLTTKIKHPEKQEKRLGADQAFLMSIGDCDEFTDLFITLARIRGIPCRRLTGYFIHKVKLEAEPHAWGEILSPTIGWIPIDIALHNLGNHTINYIVVKIEEFNPSLSDYQVIRPSSAVHYNWECSAPLVTPIY